MGERGNRDGVRGKDRRRKYKKYESERARGARERERESAWDGKKEGGGREV